MKKITFTQSSFLKTKPLKNKDLKDEEKYYIKEGSSIYGTRIVPGMHTRITLDPQSRLSSVCGVNTIYFYAPHTNFLRKQK